MKIKKYHHYPSFCNLGIKPIKYKENFVIKKEITFTKDSVFIFSGNDKFDWSKLFGFSFCHHQRNESYRFGFRFLNENEVQICKYIYKNGQRIISDSDLFTCTLNQKYTFSIEYYCTDKTIEFKIFKNNNTVFEFEEIIQNFKKYGYSLGLYIGGNQTVDKDIYFNIKTIK